MLQVPTLAEFVDIDWDTDAVDDEACYRVTDYTDHAQGGTSDASSDLAAGEVAARVHSATFEAGGTTVTLDEPLGARTIVDVGTDEPITQIHAPRSGSWFDGGPPTWRTCSDTIRRDAPTH